MSDRDIENTIITGMFIMIITSVLCMITQK